MFGKNPIRSQLFDRNSLAVESHFYTIQGEGPLAGVPALFIRLAGCNLACHFCDTNFESKADSPQPIQDIYAELASYTRAQRRVVVITGGEPMRQNFAELAYWLYLNGTDVIQVETAGTLWQPDLEQYISLGEMILVCSPKTPKVHPMIEQYCFQWKYIIIDGQVSQEDGLPNHGTNIVTQDSEMLLYRPPAKRLGSTIWVSPCDQYDAEKNNQNVQAVVRSALTYGYRVSLQMHKILGVE